MATPPVSYSRLERPWLWSRVGIGVLLLAFPLAGALGLLPASMMPGQATAGTPTVAAVAAVPTAAAAAPTLAAVAPTAVAAAPTLAAVASTVASGAQATPAPGAAAGAGAAALPAIALPAGFRITSPTFPVSGTAAPNSRVEVVVDGQVVGTATAGADGKWTIPSVTLPSGAREMLVRTVDATGKETGKSAPIALSSLGFGQTAAAGTVTPVIPSALPRTGGGGNLFGPAALVGLLTLGLGLLLRRRAIDAP